MLLLDNSGHWVPGISTTLDWKMENCSAEYGSFYPSPVFDKTEIFPTALTVSFLPVLLDLLKNVASQHALNRERAMFPQLHPCSLLNQEWALNPKQTHLIFKNLALILRDVTYVLWYVCLEKNSKTDGVVFLQREARKRNLVRGKIKAIKTRK